MIKFYSNTISKSLKIFSLLFISLMAQANNTKDVQQILNEINHYRRLHLLKPLTLNSSLNQIALKHSQNMAQHVYAFGHIGFDQRFAKIRQIMPNTAQASENVAYGYKTIHAVVDGWTHSPGHRANILGSFDLTGIAIAYDKQHRPYYTQIFARQGRPVTPHITQISRHRHVGPSPQILLAKVGEQLTKILP